MLKLQPWTGERAGALLSDVRPDSEPTYCVRAVFRRRTRTEQTPAEGLLHALWEATDREAVRILRSVNACIGTWFRQITSAMLADDRCVLDLLSAVGARLHYGFPR